MTADTWENCGDLHALADEIVAVIEDHFGERLAQYQKVLIFGTEDERIILTTAQGPTALALLVSAIGSVCEDIPDRTEQRAILRLLAERVLAFAQADA